MVEDLIQRARRRLILNEAMAQSAFAASVIVGGLLLLLLFGTAWLQWWTLAVFAAVGIGIAVYKVARRAPAPYKTAVQLDESAHLHDALSTSLHFASHPAVVSEEFRQSQRAQAELAASSVHLQSTVPYTLPRTLYAMAALCVAASILIGLRYRVGQGLDLRRPITELLFQDEAARTVKQPGQFRNSKPGSWADEAQQLLTRLGVQPTPDQPLPGDPDALDKAIEKAMQPGNPGGKDNKGPNSEKGGPQGKDGAASDESPGGDPINGADKSKGDPKEGASGANPKEGEPGDKGSPSKAGEASKESLMSKLKDAVSSLLAKNKPEPSPQQRSQDQKQSKGEKQKGEKKGDAGQGKPETGDTDSEASQDDPNGDAQGGQKGEGKESSASNQKQAQEGSGIGTQDGSKEQKAAEQLKAMGKISEIIGKRSATVSGETSVEVQSGNQALHTAYSNTRAAHSETDGDVTRDEIPVALQGFVQQYFTEVRKSAKKPAATTPAP
jgi:hypothetical protein